MISRLGLIISRVFARVVPDPFVIAVILTLFVAALALLLGDFPGVPRGEGGGVGVLAKGGALLVAWGGAEGLWKFLAFSMQMCLILVTGHALAEAPSVRRVLRGLGSLPRSGPGAAALVGAVACATAAVNWGLGLIVGALLARDTARSLHARGVRAHYPLLVAAGYTGLMVWHGGLSGSAPLSMTSAADMARVLPAPTIATLGAAGFGGGVPLGRTTFSTLNLGVTLGLLAIVPVVLALLSPRREGDIQTIADLAPELVRDLPRGGAGGRAARGAQDHTGDLPERLDRSPVVALLLAVPLLGVFARFLVASGPARLGLNEVSMLMLALGLLLHGSPRSYIGAAQDAGAGCVGIILQFPLYGGIMAMLIAGGLVRQFADGMTALAGERTLPLFTFASAAVVNLFIPSGGGQWGVQGPIAIESGLGLGVDPGRMVMSVAYGDQLTNMLQPFWALPLLAITGVKARDIVGYTCVVMLFGAVWMGVGLAAM